MRSDNASASAKIRVRTKVARNLPANATVLEGFAGTNALYRSVWHAFDGVTMDKSATKAIDAARLRPRWAVYRGDTERALLAGWMGAIPFDVVDLDAWGSPWPFFMAWATSKRARAELTTLILTDGYQSQASIAPRCRALFNQAATRTVGGHRKETSAVHALVQGAMRSGTISNAEPCELCGAVQRKMGGNAWFVVRHHFDYDKPLETIPLCLPCHKGVHGGKLIEPRTGRAYARPMHHRGDMREDEYLLLARRRVAEWTGAEVVSWETVADRKMRLHTIRLRYSASSR